MTLRRRLAIGAGAIVCVTGLVAALSVARHEQKGVSEDVADAAAAASSETVLAFTFTNTATATVPVEQVTVTVTAPPEPPPTTTTLPPASTETIPATTTEPPTTTAPPPTANLFLTPTGSDTAVCSSAAPCRTFARAYTVAASGAVVSVDGVFPAQNFAGGYQASQAKGTKTITFRGEPGNAVRQLHSGSPNITYDGINVDANRQKTSGAAFEMGGANNVVFKNGTIGNVTDEKGALVENNMTFDNVVFHDVRLATAGVHSECVFAISVPGFTIRNSTFRNCVTMDLAFTSGTWWSPPSPQYGNVTIEDNWFGRSVFPNETTTHYIGVNIGCINGANCEGVMTGWVVRRNFFENDLQVSPAVGTGNVFCGNTGAAPASFKVAC